MVLRAAERYLTRHRFTVIATKTLEGALRLLDIWKVSAVVVDLNLDGADGLALVRAVHAWHRGVACIAFTGYGCEKAREIGIPCVHKEDPRCMRELVSKLRASLGYGPNG